MLKEYFYYAQNFPCIFVTPRNQKKIPKAKKMIQKIVKIPMELYLYPYHFRRLKFLRCQQLKLENNMFKELLVGALNYYLRPQRLLPFWVNNRNFRRNIRNIRRKIFSIISIILPIFPIIQA